MTTQLNPQNELFRRRVETIALIDHLQRQPIGTTVNYETLNEVAHGLNVQYKARYLLESAVRILWQEGVYYVSVHGVGLRRLSNAEAVTESRSFHKKRMVNDTTRYRGKIEAIDPSKLPADQRQNYYLAAAEIVIRETVTSKGAEKALAQHVSQKPAQSLGLGKDHGQQMIDAFLKSGVVG